MELSTRLTRLEQLTRHHATPDPRGDVNAILADPAARMLALRVADVLPSVDETPSDAGAVADAVAPLRHRANELERERA